MKSPISVDEAYALVLARATPLETEIVGVARSSGRVLAEEALAETDLPPFPSSAMDGFAVRSADTPGRLRLVGTAAAGAPSTRVLGPGEAIAVATGAVVPDGADAVVPLEQAAVDGDHVVVGEPAPAGAHIRPRGGDVAERDPVLVAGSVLGSAQIAALAAAGVAHAVCHRRPRVSILTTGTELRAPGEPLGPGQIYESNGAMLAAALAATGAIVTRLATVDDDPDRHRAAIEEALAADVAVTAGGVSVGPHDLVRRTGAELGVEEVFWGVAMRPGKPLSFAVRGATLVFGLPGNPVSALVGATLFVAPALRALQGASTPEPPWRYGTLAAAAPRHPSRDDFLRARATHGERGTLLSAVTGQESHMIVRAAAADVIVHVPAGEGELAAGATARYTPLC